MKVQTPDLGVDSAVVSDILVQVGDSVSPEQSLISVESDKASVEVPSPVAGVIKAILVKEGQTIQQGDDLFELDQGQESEQQSTTQQSHQVDQSTPAQSSDQPSTPARQHNASDSQPQTRAQSVDQNQQISNESAERTIEVPDLGVESAVVSEIFVQVGDTITVEQSILSVESDKASVEVPSPYAGKVKSVSLKVGDQIQQGAIILTLEEKRLSDSVSNAESVQSNTNAADQSQQKDSLQEASSDQQTVQSVKTEADAVPQLTDEQIAANKHVYAGPAVRQLARHLGIVLSEVKGSGQHSRILKEDVYAYVKSRLTASSTSAPTITPVASGLPALPSFDKFGGTTLHPLSRLQQVSIPQLSLNNFIPQVTQFDHADITDLEEWRNSLKADYKKQNISLTILAFIAKALAYLLRQEPIFNSHLADDQKSLLLRQEIHIGIAVATEDGLTVPVLRHPDQKTIKQIAIELGELSQKARDKKLKPQDLQGAGFTITSLGSIGGTAFTPLVNWPQVAILGISPATFQPVWNGESFTPRLMLPLSLSYDHRVVNGADAARFTNRLSQILADIRQVLL